MDSGPREVPPQSDPRRYVRPPDDAYDTSEAADREYHRYQAVNNVLIERLVERITGRGESSKTVYDINPKDQFFAGSLASQFQYREAKDSDDAFGNIATRVAPFTMGLQFKLPKSVPDDETVTIRPTSKVFYRRLPTFEEQKDFGGEVGFDPEIADDDALTPSTPENSATDHNEDSSGEGDEVDNTDDVALEEIRPVYERVELEIKPLTVTAGELKRAARSDGSLRPLQDDDALAAAIEESREDGRRYREPDAPDQVPPDDDDKIPETAMEDDETFELFLERRFSGEVRTPVWDFEIDLGAQYDGDEVVITASFVNTHGRDYPNALNPKGEEWPSRSPPITRIDPVW